MGEPNHELCIICGTETGRAGASDDSLYDDDANGPYCENCYNRTNVVFLRSRIAELEAHNVLLSAVALAGGVVSGTATIGGYDYNACTALSAALNAARKGGAL